MHDSYVNSLKELDTLRIEMVCLGNICRSPMAAAVLHNKAQKIEKPRIHVSSSGTSGWNDGENAHHLSEKTWTLAGYDYTHISRKFQVSFFENSDLILAMDLTNRANILNCARTESDRQKVKMLRSFDPSLSHIDPVTPEADSLQVPDPWGETIAAYQDVLAMIERATDGLIATLTS
jgi:protein-tyrosine phosphatase